MSEKFPNFNIDAKIKQARDEVRSTNGTQDNVVVAQVDTGIYDSMYDRLLRAIQARIEIKNTPTTYN